MSKSEKDDMQAAAIVEIVMAVRETIREVKQAPAGVIYASLMSHGCTLKQYQAIESILIGSGKIKKIGDVLVWVD